MISCFLPRLRPQKMASCRDCPCDSASCRDSQQEAKSHGQSLQQAISQAQQSWQEARDRRQSRRKPNMTVSAGSENWRTCLYPVFADSSLHTVTVKFEVNTCTQFFDMEIWKCQFQPCRLYFHRITVIRGKTCRKFLYRRDF